MNKYLLKLYVAGQTIRSGRAIANAQRICDNELKGLVELIIVDIVERPEIAEEEKILATPTLIRHLPPPLRRMIGDLSDTNEVLMGLDLHHDQTSLSADK